MCKILLRLAFCLLFSASYASQQQYIPWDKEYHYKLVERSAEHIAHLSTFPVMRYPNKKFANLAHYFPENKILVFGYGSLMNRTSAEHTLTREAAKTMRPVIGFGLKRIFNYKSNPGQRWGHELDPREKAMLNVMPMTTYGSIINGVVFELSVTELENLVKRELGYDLVPILIADWEDVKNRSGNPKIQIAYAFIVPEEVRCGIAYVNRKYYPVRGYLKAVREGATAFGEDFFEFFEATTYLANGTTLVRDWDEATFKENLKPCKREPGEGTEGASTP
ncbi:MAG: gamma-glutamylcyclotransferase family protein [Chlamydiales bacterium]|nr:gamma-glutamylcyclotransferase family protein [Chlamydiales bacterium]